MGCRRLDTLSLGMPALHRNQGFNEAARALYIDFKITRADIAASLKPPES
jgi:hypothetical protein